MNKLLMIGLCASLYTMDVYATGGCTNKVSITPMNANKWPWIKVIKSDGTTGGWKTYSATATDPTSIFYNNGLAAICNVGNADKIVVYYYTQFPTIGCPQNSFPCLSIVHGNALTNVTGTATFSFPASHWKASFLITSTCWTIGSTLNITYATGGNSEWQGCGGGGGSGGDRNELQMKQEIYDAVVEEFGEDAANELINP